MMSIGRAPIAPALVTPAPTVAPGPGQAAPPGPGARALVRRPPRGSIGL